MTAILAVSTILPAFPAPLAQAAVQDTYRWRNDNGSETTATYMAAESTPITDVVKGSTERLRVGWENADDDREFFTLINTTLTPSSDQSFIKASAIDPAAGYGYYVSTSISFATGCHVLKTDLSTMTVVDDVDLGHTCDYATAVIDTTNEFLYVGDDASTLLNKIDINPSHSYALVDTLDLTFQVSSSVIDTTTLPNYAYFGQFGGGNQVAKVDLSAFSLVGTLTTSTTGNFRAAIIDPAGGLGYAYFVTFTSPAQISKIDLNTFSETSVLNLDSGTVPGGSTVPGGYAFVIDTSGPTHYAYLDGFDAPSLIAKIDLNTFTVPVAPITGVPYAGSAILDTTGSTHYAYFGASGCEPLQQGCTSNGPVMRVKLSNFTNSGIFGIFSLRLSTMQLDAANELVYIGTADDPSHVIKVSLAGGGQPEIQYGLKTSTCAAISTWTNVGTSGGTQDWTMSPSANITNGAATTDSPGLTNGATTFVPGQIVDTNPFPTAVIYLKDDQFTELEFSLTPTTHAQDGGAYCFRMTGGFGSSTTAYAEATLVGPHQNAYRWRNDDGSESTATYSEAENAPLTTPTATPARLRLGVSGPIDPDPIPMTEESELFFNAGESSGSVSVIDTANGFVYYGTSDSPAYIVKVRESDNTEVGSILLNSGENNLNSAVIDTTNGFAYFGTDGSPATIIKIDLSNFTRVGAIALNSGENRARSAVIDPASGFAYFGLFGTSGVGKVAKINLTSFTEVGSAISFSAGENHPRSAVVDLTNHFAYFGTLGSSCGAGGCGTDSYVVKVDIDPGHAFARVASLGVQTPMGETVNLRTGVIDVGNQFAYFGDQNGEILKIDLSPLGFDSFITDSDFGYLSSSVIDTSKGFAYFGGNFDTIVYQIDLASFTEISKLTLDSNDSLFSATIDPAAGVAFFGGQFDSLSAKIRLPQTAGLRLEYGVNTSSCGAISSWTQVGTTGGSEDWTMSASPNISDGAATTDSAGLTNGAATFSAGEIKDTTSQTSPLSFNNTHFTEVEYSIEANGADADGTDYCFRITNGGVSDTFAYTHYAEATIGAGGGGGGGTTPTGDNRVVQSRLKIGESSTADVYFTLADTLDGTLTVTFPSDYTITGAPTSGTCETGTIDTFGFSNATKTFTAEKHGCSGDVQLLGGTVVNPATPGPKLVSWVNDDPGFAIVAITGDDQIMVTAAVNSFITFQVTTDHTGANADCSHGTDPDSGDHTPSTDGGVVQLGLLDPTSVASSDAARNGAATDDGDSDASPVTAGTDVQHICTFVSTNAGGGYALTVQSENGALGSDSTPADTIPATPVTGAPASVLVTPGTERYTLCLSTSDVPQMDATTPVGSPLTASGAYLSGACTGSNASQTAGELSTQTTEIGSNAGAVQEGTAQWLVKTSISSATKAHADYDDTLTFIATGSF